MEVLDLAHTCTCHIVQTGLPEVRRIKNVSQILSVAKTLHETERTCLI